MGEKPIYRRTHPISRDKISSTQVKERSVNKKPLRERRKGKRIPRILGSILDSNFSHM